MRYKVFVPKDLDLDEVARKLESATKVFLTSRGFRFVATGDLSKEIRSTLEAQGLLIYPDEQFDPDDFSQ